MKPTTLLLSAGLLSALCALPATATPMLIDSALLVQQASVNPIFMQYEGIDGSIAAIEEGADIIDATVAEALRSTKPPPSTETLTVQRIASGERDLAELLREAADANSSTDSAGRRVIDCEGFAHLTSSMLNNKNPELTRYAALGWNLTEKRAATKLAGIAKDPTLELVNGAVIAIIKGFGKELDKLVYYGDSHQNAIGGSIDGMVDANDYQVWR